MWRRWLGININKTENKPETNSTFTLVYVYAAPIQYKTLEQWEAEGGTLLKETEIGCGINVLTYLGLMDRQEGERNVRLLQIDPIDGTLFTEVLNLLQKKWAIEFPLEEYTFSLQDPFYVTCEALTKFYLFVLDRFPDGSCIIIKLNKYWQKKGHYLILHIVQKAIFTIDPQLMKERLTYDLESTPESNHKRLTKIASLYTSKTWFSVSLAVYKV